MLEKRGDRSLRCKLPVHSHQQVTLQHLRSSFHPCAEATRDRDRPAFSSLEGCGAEAEAYHFILREIAETEDRGVDFRILLQELGNVPNSLLLNGSKAVI